MDIAGTNMLAAAAGLTSCRKGKIKYMENRGAGNNDISGFSAFYAIAKVF